LEIYMNINAPVLNAKFQLCSAVAMAFAVLSGPIQAAEQIVTVKQSVSSAGIDPNQPAGALELYGRVQSAANIVCRYADRVDLKPVPNFVNCYEKALGDAVRSARLPQLTMVYLRTHTPLEAATRGISVPVLVAAK
jgi:UrcA family protein